MNKPPQQHAKNEEKQHEKRNVHKYYENKCVYTDKVVVAWWLCVYNREIGTCVRFVMILPDHTPLI